MQFRLIGLSHYGFTNDKGQYIEGFKFHISRPPTIRGFEGEEVAAISVSEQIVQRCGKPKVGVLYGAVYDQKGKLCNYAPLQQQTRIPNT